MYNLQEIVKAKKKTFIDVRSEQEFMSGHIEAPLMFRYEIRLKMEDIEQMEKPLVVYCLSGGRSSAAVGFWGRPELKKFIMAAALAICNICYPPLLFSSVSLSNTTVKNRFFHSSV